jgi:hypothetical protein
MIVCDLFSITYFSTKLSTAHLLYVYALPAGQRMAGFIFLCDFSHAEQLSTSRRTLCLAEAALQCNGIHGSTMRMPGDTEFTLAMAYVLQQVAVVWRSFPVKFVVGAHNIVL